MKVKVVQSLKGDLTYEAAKKDIFSDEAFKSELKALADAKRLGILEAEAIVHRYLNEIASRYSKSPLFWNILEAIVRKKIINRFDRIIYNSENLKSIKELAKDNLIALVPN